MIVLDTLECLSIKRKNGRIILLEAEYGITERREES